MNLNQTIKMLAVSLMATSLVNCGGGGGSGSVSTGGSYYTHAELAQIFVDRVFTDVGDDLTLIKANTEQYDYIVVFDEDYLTYDAYYIGAYNVGDNLFDYLYDYDLYNYYDLDPIANNRYEDYYTGLIFEKSSTAVYNQQKLSALKQYATIQKSASSIVSSYGLPQESALRIAKLGASLSGTDLRSLSPKAIEEIGKEAMGVNPADYAKAFEQKVQTGDSSLLDSLNAQSAQYNKTSPAVINRMVEQIAMDMMDGKN